MRLFYGKSKYRIGLIMLLAFLLQIPLAGFSANADTDLVDNPVENIIMPADQQDAGKVTDPEEKQPDTGDLTPPEGLPGNDQDGKPGANPKNDEQATDDSEIPAGDTKDSSVIAPLNIMGMLMELLGEPEPFPFITGVRITDENDIDLELGNEVDKSATVRIHFDWKIPDNDETTVPDGATYGMTLPAEIEIIGEMNIPLNNGDVTVADVAIKTNGEVIITFTEYASQHSNVTGSFYIQTQFDEDEIGNANPVEIKFEVEGESEPFTVKINFEQPDPTISKKGTYDPATNTITWTAEINPEEVTIENAIFKDAINTGQEYVNNSFSITPTPDPAGTFDYTAASNEEKSGTLTYTFPTLIKDRYIISFETKVTAFKGADLDQYNQAWLTHDNGPTYSNNAKVVVSVDLISKNGSYKQTDKKIDWIITVNPDKLPNLENVTVSDIIPTEPAKLALMTDTVYLENQTSPKVKTQLTASDYTYNTETNVFEYNFPDTISDTYQITYSTSVPDGYYYKYNDASKTFTNKVVLTTDNIPGVDFEAGKGIGVGNSVITKAGAGYNRTTQEITWRITVNSNKIAITNAVVTDTIPDGQVFVANSVTQSVGSFSYSKNDSNKETLTFNLGDINSEQTITFKTKVPDPTVTAANGSKDYKNTAKLIGDNITASTSQGTQKVTSEVIKKTGGIYDYTSRELSWKIVVNQNKMPLSNAVVTDIIEAGQEYVVDSFQLNGAEPAAGIFSYHTDDSNKETLTFNLGDINAEQTITFKTKITDLSIFETNGDKQLQNTAKLTNDFGPVVSSTGSITVKNTLVGKVGDYERGNLYIDWLVTINQNLLPLTEAELVDELQEGLALDTSSVKLYKLTLNSDGSLTQGSEVALNADNISYNGATGEFIFTMPAPAEGEYLGAYLLKFRTDVVDESKSPFTNTISFSGSETEESSNDEKVTIRTQSGGGWAIGETGSITVIKVDDNDDTKTLSGAIFALLDQYKNKLKESLPTVEDGKAVFDKLKFGVTYYIQEITAPKDYVPSDELYEFQLANSSDGKNITYEFKNQEVTGSITIIKVDSVNTDRQLPGAVFELLDADQEFIKTITADTNGVAVFDELKINTTYFIKEKTPPSGYRLSDEIYEFQVKNSEGELDIEYTFENVKIPSSSEKTGSIQVVKVDAEDSNLKLSGAVFELLDANKNVIKESSPTIYNGIVVFNQLKLNTTYFVREKIAPAGYQLSTELYEFTVPSSSNQRDITYEFKNSKPDQPEVPVNPEVPEEPGEPKQRIGPEDPSPGVPFDGEDPSAGQPGEEPIGFGDDGTGKPLPRTGGNSIPLYLASLGLLILGIAIRRKTV